MAVLLETEDSQRQMGFGAHLSKGFCNIGAAKVTKEADNEIPERSHDSWSIASSYL